MTPTEAITALSLRARQSVEGRDLFALVAFGVAQRYDRWQDLPEDVLRWSDDARRRHGGDDPVCSVEGCWAPVRYGGPCAEHMHDAKRCSDCRATFVGSGSRCPECRLAARRAATNRSHARARTAATAARGMVVVARR